MNIPTFIRREWYGHGRAVLTFFHTGTNGESAEATSLNKEGGVIECYTSSVLIRYGILLHLLEMVLAN